MKRDHIDVIAFVPIDFKCFCNKYNEHFANENSDLVSLAMKMRMLCLWTVLVINYVGIKWCFWNQTDFLYATPFIVEQLEYFRTNSTTCSPQMMNKQN